MTNLNRRNSHWCFPAYSSALRGSHLTNRHLSVLFQSLTSAIACKLPGEIASAETSRYWRSSPYRPIARRATSFAGARGYCDIDAQEPTATAMAITEIGRMTEEQAGEFTPTRDGFHHQDLAVGDAHYFDAACSRTFVIRTSAFVAFAPH